MTTIGRRIEKDFGDYGMFMGTVTTFDEKSQLFLVKYEDDDEEEFSLSELKKLFVDLE